MANSKSTTERVRRNPYTGKWNILFDRVTTQWISFKPQEDHEVYPCYACRDMFGSKNSYLDHVNRRGILLTYKCRICSQTSTITFYNPCALLLHTRKHYGSTSGQIDLDDLAVATLPLGLAGFLPHPNINVLYNVVEDYVDDNSVSTKFYSPLRQDRGQQIVNLAPTILLFYYNQTLNNPAVSLVLKQISSNIPRCKFVVLESHILSTVASIDKQQEAQSNDSSNNNATLLHGISIKEEPPERINNDGYAPAVSDLSVVPKLETVESDETQVNTNTKASQQPEDAQAPEGHYNCCSECRKVQKTSMAVHFTNNNNNRPLNENLKCAVCKYIAPSKCSLQAHQRIHEGVPPYVCPECGKDFQDCEMLLDHLDEVCFHLAKQVRFRCPKTNCCKVFAQTATFLAHFAVHVQTFTRCRICFTYFCSLNDFLEHAKLQHGNAVATEVIYRCTVCVNGGPPFTEDAYQSHIKWHCSNRAHCIYVYVCKYCRSFFRSTLTYATHLLRCSKKACGDDGRKVKRSNTATICSNCNYIIRMITTISHCPKCGEPFNTPYTVKQNAEANSATDVEVRPSNTHPTKKNQCLLCQKIMTLEEHVDHINKRKCRFNYPVVILHRDSVDTGSPPNKKDAQHSPHSKSDENFKRKRRRHVSITPTSVRNKKLNLSSPPSDLLRLEEPKPFDGTYHCKLCEYNNNDRTDFHGHIVTHRNISTAYQCMDCGECFVVKPSLQKHLLYYHQVTDFDSYIEENDCFDRSAVSELYEITNLAPGETKQPVAENQCRVCLRQFQDDLELSKHFRVHGMAFLMKNTK